MSIEHGSPEIAGQVIFGWVLARVVTRFEWSKNKPTKLDLGRRHGPMTKNWLVDGHERLFHHL